jgi:hypothetical protein
MCSLHDETPNARRADGHGQPCQMCGEPINSYTGSAGKWGVALPLGGGIMGWHHSGCVVKALRERDAAREALGKERERCAKIAEDYVAGHKNGHACDDWASGEACAARDIAELIRTPPAEPAHTEAEGEG